MMAEGPKHVAWNRIRFVIYLNIVVLWLINSTYQIFVSLSGIWTNKILGYIFITVTRMYWLDNAGLWWMRCLYLSCSNPEALRIKLYRFVHHLQMFRKRTYATCIMATKSGEVWHWPELTDASNLVCTTTELPTTFTSLCLCSSIVLYCEAEGQN
jgi:hypothetical protein